MLKALSKFHPLFIEGMGLSDTRDANFVARQVVQGLESHFEKKRVLDPNWDDKPKILIMQGDPTAVCGVSAIIALVSEMLGIPRGLVVLDDHSINASRDNVVWETKYSDVLSSLPIEISNALEESVDAEITTKNDRRRLLGGNPLQSYSRDFAMLQEVTKAAAKLICGDITVLHTQKEISEFSVTSFYSVGLDLKLLDFDLHYVPYIEEENLDFKATLNQRQKCHQCC